MYKRVKIAKKKKNGNVPESSRIINEKIKKF